MIRSDRFRIALALGVSLFGVASSASAEMHPYRYRRNMAVVERDRRQELRRQELRRQKELEKQKQAEAKEASDAAAAAPTGEPAGTDGAQD
jgi:hypothetical protein